MAIWRFVVSSKSLYICVCLYCIWLDIFIPILREVNILTDTDRCLDNAVERHYFPRTIEHCSELLSDNQLSPRYIHIIQSWRIYSTLMVRYQHIGGLISYVDCRQGLWRHGEIQGRCVVDISMHQCQHYCDVTRQHYSDVTECSTI